MIYIFIIISLVSCSKNNIQNEQNKPPLMPNDKLDIIPGTTQFADSFTKLPEGDIRYFSPDRKLAAYPDAPTFRFMCIDEDEDCDSNAHVSLLHDIASTHIIPQQGSTHNYLLTVDRKKVPCATSDKCRLFITGTNPTQEDHVDPAGAGDNYYWGLSDGIDAPVGCDLFYIREDDDEFYSIISDWVDKNVRMYKHEIDGDLSSGMLKDPSWMKTFSDASMTSVAGCAGCVTNPTTNPIRYLIFVCDPANNRIRVFDNDGLDTSGNVGAGNRPVDVCVVRPRGVYNEGYVYVAVQSTTDRDNDYIHVFKATGDPWSSWTDLGALTVGGSATYFPYITKVAVASCDFEYDETNYNNHFKIAVYMHDYNDWLSCYIRLLDVPRASGSPPVNYYDDSTHNMWLDDETHIKLPEGGLALGITSGGFIYFAGDRDPDLNHEDANGDGENVAVWSS